jgi:hypothetical protein
MAKELMMSLEKEMRNRSSKILLINIALEMRIYLSQEKMLSRQRKKTVIYHFPKLFKLLKLYGYIPYKGKMVQRRYYKSLIKLIDSFKLY